MRIFALHRRFYTSLPIKWHREILNLLFTYMINTRPNLTASACKTKRPRTSHILDDIASSLPRDVTNKLVWMEGLLLEIYFICNKKITLKPSICKFIIYKNKVYTYKWYSHKKEIKFIWKRQKITHTKNNGTHHKSWYREFSC